MIYPHIRVTVWWESLQVREENRGLRDKLSAEAVHQAQGEQEEEEGSWEGSNGGI